MAHRKLNEVTQGDNALGLIETMLTEFERLRSYISETEDQVRRLQGGEMADASLYWSQGGEYLYLNYHKQGTGTKRKRVYVGNDPKKVAAALEKVDRFRRYTQIKRKQKLMMNVITMIYSRYTEAVRDNFGSSFLDQLMCEDDRMHL